MNAMVSAPVLAARECLACGVVHVEHGQLVDTLVGDPETLADIALLLPEIFEAPQLMVLERLFAQTTADPEGHFSESMLVSEGKVFLMQRLPGDEDHALVSIHPSSDSFGIIVARARRITQSLLGEAR